MKKIYFDNGVWKGFEAPGKMTVPKGFEKHAEENNKQAYAAARAAALPIINPEILDDDAEVFSYDVYKIINDIAEPQDYEWGGTWEVLQYTCNHTKGKKEIECPRSQVEFPECCGKQESAIVLSLPAKEIGKTAANVLFKHHVIQSPYLIPGSAIEAAMQEYSDQQLAAFKEAVIKTIRNHHVYGETTNLIKRDELIKSIDQL